MGDAGEGQGAGGDRPPHHGARACDLDGEERGGEDGRGGVGPRAVPARREARCCVLEAHCWRVRLLSRST